MNPETPGQMLKRAEDEAREMERLVALGGVELDARGKPERQEPETLADIGIHNRRAARRAGLRSPKRQRRMVVPK